MPVSHWTQYTFKRPWKCVYNSDISLNCDGFNGKLLCWWNIVSCTWNGRGWNFLQRDSLSINVSHYNNISRCILIQLFFVEGSLEQLFISADWINYAMERQSFIHTLNWNTTRVLMLTNWIIFFWSFIIMWHLVFCGSILQWNYTITQIR